MTTTDNARQQANAQLQHIRELVGWLEHANECRWWYSEPCNWQNEYTVSYIGKDAADDDDAKAQIHDPETAQQAIQESVLSVEVRGGWRILNAPEGETAAEFRILLCTGGPAVRIVGELDEYGNPESARLEYQDWFTPWTAYGQEYGTRWTDAEETPVLTFCQQFYFGS